MLCFAKYEVELDCVKHGSVGSGNYIYFWISTGLSDERINSITTFTYKIIPELSHYGTKARVNLVAAV